MKTDQANSFDIPTTPQEYDADYAADYDRRFIHGKFASNATAAEVQIIRSLLLPHSRWLDVACGTGYFLSQFPNVERSGLDASEAMLGVAAKANPGVSFRHGSFLEPVPEWKNHWDLVSCMWWAFGLVDSLSQVQSVVSNLSSWTSPSGTLFIPFAGPEDLCGTTIPYNNFSAFGGRVFVTSITWSWVEDDGRRHDLVSPLPEHLLGMCRQYFDDVQIINYPPFAQSERNKAILARNKRAAETVNI